MKNDQAIGYGKVRQRFIEVGTASFLIDELYEIKEGNKEKDKYTKLINEISTMESYFDNVKDIRIIYIGPVTIDQTHQLHDFEFFSFSQIAEVILEHTETGHEKSYCWELIKGYFKENEKIDQLRMEK